MSKIKSRTVTAKNSDGNDVTVVVKRPNSEDLRKARLYAGKICKEAIESDGCMLREKLNNYMRDQGLWDDVKEKSLKELIANLQDGETRLNKGGMPKTEAKELALKMRRWRLEQTQLLSTQNELDEFTIEGQTENAKFDFLASICILNEESGKPVFDSIDEYFDNSDEPYIIKACSSLAQMQYNLDPSWQQKLPENKFLIAHGFMNSDMQFINEHGQIVSSDGKLIDGETGRYINAAGEFVNAGGERVDEDGNLLVESQPFTD